MTKSDGVMFGDKHSFNDFGLILTDKSLPFPGKKTYKIQIPGKNGDLDLSDVTTNGIPKFENRTLTFNFFIARHVTEREGVYSMVANAIHGRVMDVTLDVDAGYYYHGTCQITSKKDESVNHGTLTVSVDAEPYKYNAQLSTDRWLWDTFNFESGVIWEWVTKTYISGGMPMDFDIPIIGMPVVPTFITDAPLSVGFEGVTYQVLTGTSLISNIVLTERSHVLSIMPTDGEATFSLQFRGGIL